MIPINRNGNCTSDLIGSGSRSCDIQTYGDVIGFVLHPKSWSLNAETDTITSATWKDEIKDFNAIPFIGIYDFTQDTPENERATSSTGVMSPIRQGKPQFSFSFDKGGCFHKALYDKRGKNRWDISFIFETGILHATNVAGETFEGFDMGIFDVGTFLLQQGTDPQRSTAMIQLVDASQFNSLHAFTTWDELGVNLSKIEGVIQAQVSYATEPAVGDSEIVVQVANSCNYDDTLAGFDGADFWRLAGTQSVTITGVTLDTDTSLYTIALSGALVAGTVQPVLSTDGVDVVEIEGDGLYKGKGSLVTLTEPTT